MGFADTYREEVLQSRRIRSRRVLFWSRIVGLALVILIAAILRAEPDLRRALLTAGMNTAARVTGIGGEAGPTLAFANPQNASREAFPGISPATNPLPPSNLPRSQVKVNRHNHGPAFQSSGSNAINPRSFDAGDIDPQSLIEQVTHALSGIQPGQ